MFKDAESVNDLIRDVLGEFEQARDLQTLEKVEELKRVREFAEYLMAKVQTEWFNAQEIAIQQPTLSGRCDCEHQAT